MRQNVIIIFFLVLLTLAQFTLPHRLQAQATTTRIGIEVAHNNLRVSAADLSNLSDILSANRIQMLFDTGNLNQTFLRSIDALIISAPQTNFTGGEINDLANWYASRGRLWISADYQNMNTITSLNSLLQAIGTGLRFEYGYASDPLYNLNSSSSGADNVILPLINHLPADLEGLTTDVRALYAYRAVPIVSSTGTGYIQFNATQQPNDLWIAETSSSALVLNSSSHPLLAYNRGASAKIPVVVTERISNGKLALTGSAFFSQSMQTFIYNQSHPYDNRLLTRNLLAWLTSIRIQGELEAKFPEIQGSGQPQVLIYTGSQSLHSTSAELQPLLNLLSDMGLNAQTFPVFTADAVRNASTIIIQTPLTPINSFENTVITNWMAVGNKRLILASMADYAPSGNATQSYSLNRVLIALQSSLRFEQGALYDPETNLGGDPSLTLASNLNHLSPDVTNLTVNIRSLSMQFGTILAGSNQTVFLPLENETVLNSLTNVTWIAKTSSQSYVADLDPSIPMQAHKEGQRGSYIVAALERYRLGKYNDTILLTGGPILADFSRLLEYPTLFGYPTDNLLFLRNIFRSLLKQTEIKTQLSAAASPKQLSEGGNVTVNLQYNALFKSTSNLTETYRVPITPANITMSLAGTTLTTNRLPNQTYSGGGIPGGTGSISWSVSASAKGYQSQSSSGTVQVNALATRFAPYVLSIPIVVFIAVTIAVVARKTR